MSRAREIALLKRQVAELERRVPRAPASARFPETRLTLRPDQLRQMSRTDRRTWAALPESIRQEVAAYEARPTPNATYSAQQMQTLRELQRAGRYDKMRPIAVHEEDRTGRKITSFLGRARDFWSPFKFHRGS